MRPFAVALSKTPNKRMQGRRAGHAWYIALFEVLQTLRDGYMEPMQQEFDVVRPD